MGYVSAMMPMASGRGGAAEESLHCPEGDEQGHVGRESAKDRTYQESAHGNHEQPSPVGQVAQTPIQKGRGGGCDGVRRKDPAVQRQSLQVGCNDRKGAGHDGLIQRVDEHRYCHREAYEHHVRLASQFGRLGVDIPIKQAHSPLKLVVGRRCVRPRVLDDRLERVPHLTNGPQREECLAIGTPPTG